MREQRVLSIGVCGLLAATALFAGSQPLTVSPDLTLSSERDLIVSAPSGDIQLDASSSTISLNAPSVVAGTLCPP